jgi:hypothetical protein
LVAPVPPRPIAPIEPGFVKFVKSIVMSWSDIVSWGSSLGEETSRP